MFALFYYLKPRVKNIQIPPQKQRVSAVLYSTAHNPRHAIRRNPLRPKALRHFGAKNGTPIMAVFKLDTKCA